MKKLLSLLLVFCLTISMVCTASAEFDGAADETMEMLVDIGNQLNDQYALGAKRISWEYLNKTDDPSITLLAVATTNNSKTIVVVCGERILDDQLVVLPIWTKKKGTRTETPAAISEVITIDENTIARVYDGNIADGNTVIGVKDAWAWFIDDELYSGSAYSKGSRWVVFDCRYMYNKSSNELRKKNLHNFKLIGGYACTCTQDGESVYECSRCGMQYTKIKLAHHTPVTYPGVGTFCTHCKKKLVWDGSKWIWMK